VRQYFPKGCNFDTLTAEAVQKVEDLLNNRPRKTLNFLTPNEVFLKLSQTQNYALPL
jgi:IS30 family transposase